MAQTRSSLSLSGPLSLVDKSSGPGRTCFYFNMKLSVLRGPVLCGQRTDFHKDLVIFLLLKWTKIQRFRNILSFSI